MASELASTLGLSSVTYDSKLDKFTFSHSAPFALHFGEKQNGIAYILGFVPRKNYSSNDNHVVEAPFRCNFNVNKYVIMSVEGINIINSNNPDLHQSTVLLSRGGLDMIGIRRIVKFKNPCIPRLGKIEVKFTDYEGNLYDFQNQDHRIDFVFESKKHLSKYMV
jgi:hypothetical protein